MHRHTRECLEVQARTHSIAVICRIRRCVVRPVLDRERLTPDGRPVIVDVKACMRLTALVVTVSLSAVPTIAQEAEPSRAADNPSPQADAKSALEFPVSLDRI